MATSKIKKGDLVKVIAGKDKDKEGKVLAVDVKNNTVLVEGVNEHDTTLLTGRLSNNTLVHFAGDKSLIGNIIDVTLDECHGFYFMGHRA